MDYSPFWRPLKNKFSDNLYLFNLKALVHHKPNRWSLPVLSMTLRYFDYHYLAYRRYFLLPFVMHISEERRKGKCFGPCHMKGGVGLPGRWILFGWAVPQQLSLAVSAMCMFSNGILIDSLKSELLVSLRPLSDCAL